MVTSAQPSVNNVVAKNQIGIEKMRFIWELISACSRKDAQRFAAATKFSRKAPFGLEALMVI